MLSDRTVGTSGSSPTCEELGDHRVVDTPGRDGPDPHVHRQHVDAFYVLEGTLTFALGPQAATEVVAAAGTLVAVPPDVVHTFWNAGPGRRALRERPRPGRRLRRVHARARATGASPPCSFDAARAAGGRRAARRPRRRPRTGRGRASRSAQVRARSSTQPTVAGLTAAMRFSLPETTLRARASRSAPTLDRHDAARATRCLRPRGQRSPGSRAGDRAREHGAAVTSARSSTRPAGAPQHVRELETDDRCAAEPRGAGRASSRI